MIKRIFVSLILMSSSILIYSNIAFIQKRKVEIMNFVSEEIKFYVPKIDKREEWEKLLKYKEIGNIVKEAETYLNKEIPVLTEELYLDYSKTGNRARWEKVAAQRLNMLKAFVIAEAVENKGRFIKKVEDFLLDYCSFKTWVRPAHDKNLDNYYGRTTDIDLEAAELVFVISTVLYILDSKINSEIVKKVKQNIQTRIFLPFKRMIAGTIPENWWLRGTNNWNAVCLNGVVSSALLLLEKKEERAFFIAAAEYYIKFYFEGFSPDGYCTEGVGYWNYGFSNFVILAEMISLNTNSNLSLYNNHVVKKAIEYGFNIEITKNLAPAFADCSINDVPDRRLLYFLSKRFDIPVFDFTREIKLTERLLTYGLFYIFNDIYNNKNIGHAVKKERTYFDKHGVVILRNLKDKGLNLAIKAGHNDEHHNHNDVGSFILSVDEVPIIADPGAEIYTARTFSQQRYESKVINSYGHPVPVVSGELQRTGKEAKGVVEIIEFSDKLDRIVINLKEAYQVNNLINLKREVTFFRDDKDEITIVDSVEYRNFDVFETVLITMGDFIKLDNNKLLIFYKDKMILCEILCKDSFTISSEKILEEIRAKELPTRIAIKLDKKVKFTEIKMRFTPYDIKYNNFLINGDFEYKSFGWNIPHDSMGSIEEKITYNGKYSLKIEDNDDKKGSNVTTTKIELPVGEYQLKGKILISSGKGLGIYINFYDSYGNLLNKRDEKGNISPLVSFENENSKWEEWIANFKIVEECRYIILWIHSFNSSKIIAFLDDLKIVSK